MSLRMHLAQLVLDEKDECGFTYKDICSAGAITNKQLSAILKGESGVSIDKIEEVLSKVFGVSVGILVVKNKRDSEEFLY